MTDTDIAALVERLRGWVTDWDGSKMVRGTTPRDGMHCDIIYDAADALEACQARAEKAERQAEAQWAGWIKEKDRAVKAEAANERLQEQFHYAVRVGQEAREQALEEAAKVAGDMIERYGEHPAAEKLAAAIRALSRRHSK